MVKTIMFILNGFRLLFRHYLKIIPFYWLAIFAMGGLLFVTFPIGFILALLIGVGMAYYMTRVVITGEKTAYSTILKGFESSVLLRNIMYILVRPLVIGVILSVILVPIYHGFLNVNETLFSETLPTWIEYRLVLVILLTITVLLTPFSLLPHLLADPQFNQRMRNPILISASMIGRYYIPLIIVRMVYTIWLTLFGLFAFWFPFLAVAFAFSGGNLPDAHIYFRVFIIIIALHFLLFGPLYRMIHTALYAQLRNNIKTASSDAA